MISRDLGHLSSLPPQVHGPVRSFLDLTIKVTWRTVKKFNQVKKIKLIWWGDKEGIFREVNDLIRYQICTSHLLWLRYLKNAAPFPLQIQFYSLKTLKLIGTSKILWDHGFDIPTDFAIVSDIRGHSLKLGEISIKFTLLPARKMTFSDANKENMQNIGKSRKCTKIQRALVSRTSSDERLFQKGSVPAALKSCQNHDMENALQEKSSLLEQHALVTSFDVFKVAFTTSAQQQIQNFMNKSPLQKFIFKCAVTSEFSQDECCLSPVFTTIPSSEFILSLF